MARADRSTARPTCPTPPSSSHIDEPWCELRIFTPAEHIGAVLDLVTKRRGELKNQTWLDTKRVEIVCMIPLSEIIVDFYNELKARTKGYASMDYNIDEYRASDMVKLDILVNAMPVDALSIIVHRDVAFHKGQRLVSKMKEIIPRQQFDVPIQAAVGTKVISRANVQGNAQGRARQVLWRRHLAQAQAAGEAEGGQEAHEDGRCGRDSAGSLHVGACGWKTMISQSDIDSGAPGDGATVYGPSILERLRRHGLSPRKSLGQNFLIEPAIADRIVAAAELAPDDIVLEIGPGPGMLTERLAAAASWVVADEIDGAMVALLNAELGSLANLTVVQADILQADPGALAAQGGEGPYKVVANLPYYITSPVLRHLLEAQHPPRLAVLMVQREVAERICAQPNDMSILAVSVQFYARPTLLFHVPADAFHPRPNVESTVLRLEVLPTPSVAGVETARFFKVVRAGFGQKRKQLANSLSTGLALPKEQTAAWLRSVDIDPARRAETLTLEEWGNLVRARP